MDKIEGFLSACRARKQLRCARVGTMGYRDMLPYGTQYEGNSMRGQLGVEVEPYEMLEMVRTVDKLDTAKVAEGVRFVKENWGFKKACDEAVIEKGVKYALAISQKIWERGWEAITLIDVDGMTKLVGFPPAWNEFGWDDPAPQLPSLEVFPDSCTVEEFAQKVSGQHVIVAYGNYTEALKDFCAMMDIEVIM